MTKTATKTYPLGLLVACTKKYRPPPAPPGYNRKRRNFIDVITVDFPINMIKDVGFDWAWVEFRLVFVLFI